MSAQEGLLPLRHRGWRARLRLQLQRGRALYERRAQPLLQRCVIHPHDKRKHAFDMAVLVGITWISVFVPLKVAFKLYFLEWLDALIDVIFVLDVILKFFTGYIKLGYPVLDQHKIATRYVRSGWLAIDLIACVPVDIFFHERFRLFSVVKSVRLLRIRRMLAKSESMRSSSVARVVLTLLAWVLLGHWFACTFYALGFYTVCTFGWYEASWITTYAEWADVLDTSRPAFCSPANSGLDSFSRSPANGAAFP